MLRAWHGRGFAEEVLEGSIEDLDDLVWVRLEELEDVDRHYERNLLIKVAHLELLLLLAALEVSTSQNRQELRLLLQRETAAGRGAGVFVVGLGGGTLGGKQVAVFEVGG